MIVALRRLVAPAVAVRVRRDKRAGRVVRGPRAAARLAVGGAVGERERVVGDVRAAEEDEAGREACERGERGSGEGVGWRGRRERGVATPAATPRR